MSATEPEIVERLRDAYAAFSRGDFDAATEVLSPDVEFTRAGVEAPLHGVDSLRAWMEPDAFESQVLEPLAFTVAGNKVLIRQRGTARGAGSGIEVTLETWVVATVGDDGMITRLDAFLERDRDAALRAAGMSA